MGKEKTYVIEEGPEGRYIKCLICNMKSYNENDINQKYCGNCQQFHSLMEELLELEKPHVRIQK